jgi:hypothetical protein
MFAAYVDSIFFDWIPGIMLTWTLEFMILNVFFK